jgi:hypothetical protein
MPNAFGGLKGADPTNSLMVGDIFEIKFKKGVKK